MSEAVAELAALFAALPAALHAKALTHSSWSGRRSESYERLAFLGDSVLGLAIAEALYGRFPEDDIGRLTKIHGQVVSGRACAAIADEMGLPEMIRDAEPDGVEGGIGAGELLTSERAIASVCEAVIGACYLELGHAATVNAVVAAFEPQITLATETLLDFKSALQERLARDGRIVSYEVVSEDGPPHDRRFEVEARVDGRVLGTGAGRSKKAAEQMSAQRALRDLG